MGFVGGLLGFGSKGGKWNAQQTDLLQGVNEGQTSNAYNQAQTGLGQQQAFLQSLAAQNGIGNQSSVFGQQQQLANQLQGLANGTGPNPALQQLQNTTGQNVANQAALMAGQRGASANTGLLARQAAMQGAGIQQQAVGQGAALQAQQQIAAMQALQQQQNMMGNLASTQVGQQGSALTGYNQAAQSEQQNLLNAMGQYNNARVSNISQQNAANAGIQGQVAKGQNDLLGGIVGGLGAAAMPKAAHGGLVKSYAEGGPVGPQSIAAKFMTGFNSGYNGGQSAVENPNLTPQQNFINTMEPGLQRGMATGVSAGIGRMFAAHGSMVPGKAEVSGDSYKNDKVPAILSPGEVVIPRSVMQSKNPAEGAAKFVQAILAKNGLRRK
jgi:hypothetical protein